jgi:hypothetical protein
VRAACASARVGRALPFRPARTAVRSKRTCSPPQMRGNSRRGLFCFVLARRIDGAGQQHDGKEYAPNHRPQQDRGKLTEFASTHISWPRPREAKRSGEVRTASCAQRHAVLCASRMHLPRNGDIRMLHNSISSIRRRGWQTLNLNRSLKRRRTLAALLGPFVLRPAR